MTAANVPKFFHEITEGSEHVLSYRETGFTNVGMQELRRIVVLDKVGRCWKSRRRSGQH